MAREALKFLQVRFIVLSLDIELRLISRRRNIVEKR
jgi:hypothetical protein